MQQINKYKVLDLGTKDINILSAEDSLLVPNFTLNSTQFIPNKHRVDVNFYTQDEVFLQSQKDIKTYSILGTVRDTSVEQITVNPVSESLQAGYQGDVIVEYEVFNDLLNNSVEESGSIYISEFSTDRTEVRFRSTDLSDTQLKNCVDNIYSKLNNEQYFSEVYLELTQGKFVITNVMSEVVDSTFYVTFKFYDPLPTEIPLKSKGIILERVGEPSRFKVVREVENIPDPVPTLKGPNFNVDVENNSTKVTDYLNYNQLLSYPVSSSYFQIYDLFDQEQTQISVDHTDYSSFIHFSSAAERLANFRYKFELLQDYEASASYYAAQRKEVKVKEYSDLAEGLVRNFDHYEKFLYYESGSSSWPKVSSQKPYKNVTDPAIYSVWYDKQYEVASAYDIGNKDILLGTIPFAIREDSRNEAYVMFVHMIGQHFDEEWLFAKAISDKYNGDNRMDFGISKDLIRDAIRDFGINFCETNQNLEELFTRTHIDGTYDVGLESGSLKYFSRISTPGERPDKSIPIEELFEKGHNNLGVQPVLREDYFREVYKRIYHNIPILLKQKGTQRGLRTLINCFGIPDNILEIKTLGGVSVEEHNFGPREGTTSSIDKIRVQDNKVEGIVLSKYIPLQQKNQTLSDDSHEVEVGFGISRETNEFLKSKLQTFDYDDIIGDPRNFEENYRDVFDFLRKNLLTCIRDPKYKHDPRFRTPSGILYFVKYFDSVLFRGLSNFVPAKTNLHTGAIIEDNILHRNRYRGVKLQVKDLDYSGSIETGFITGSNLGSFSEQVKILKPIQEISSSGLGSAKRAEEWGERYYETDTGIVTRSIEPTTNYTRTIVDCSTIFRKDIFDESPKYNGELSGSKQTIVTGELNDENTLKKGSQPANEYLFSFYYTGLPTPNFCKIYSEAKYLGEHFTILPIPTGSRYIASEYCTTVQKQDILVDFRVTSSLLLEAESSSNEPYFIGWQEGSESIYSWDDKYISPNHKYLLKSTGPRILSANYNLVEVSGSNRLKFYIRQGTPIGPYYHEYLTLDWKVEQEVYNILGDVRVRVDYSLGTEQTSSIDITLTDMFGSNSGSRTLDEIPESVRVGDILCYGVKCIKGDARGPLVENTSRVFWDADWYDTWEDWKEERRALDE